MEKVSGDSLSGKMWKNKIERDTILNFSKSCVVQGEKVMQELRIPKNTFAGI
jgi:hypothetical protein